MKIGPNLPVSIQHRSRFDLLAGLVIAIRAHGILDVAVDWGVRRRRSEETREEIRLFAEDPLELLPGWIPVLLIEARHPPTSFADHRIHRIPYDREELLHVWDLL